LNNLYQFLLSKNQISYLFFEIKEKEDFEIVLLDILGKRIWQKEKTITAGISTIELPKIDESGIYFLQIKNKQELLETLRLVVQ